MPDRFGLEKSEASRGIRQPILTWLVRAYRQVEKLYVEGNSDAAETKTKLEENRRWFVSDVQQKLDPRRTNEEFEKSMS